MIWSAFRPSDDEQQYGYLVPANMFAVVVLRYSAEIARAVWKDEALATKCERLASEVDGGIQAHAVVQHPTHGAVYAYEVDGLGGANLMDDANVRCMLFVSIETSARDVLEARAIRSHSFSLQTERDWSPRLLF
jgi:meiotically up-regulated gene 157 (Mug157) protein